eukprot:GHVT01100273.1.p1 GENE.GHVT01100273.1~~GHVT01100273.1.p1  ORF type:complete len:607 (+),score=132.01 GHVT01100273.1:205-2025(+)
MCASSLPPDVSEPAATLAQLVTSSRGVQASAGRGRAVARSDIPLICTGYFSQEPVKALRQTLDALAAREAAAATAGAAGATPTEPSAAAGGAGNGKGVTEGAIDVKSHFWQNKFHHILEGRISQDMKEWDVLDRDLLAACPEQFTPLIQARREAAASTARTVDVEITAAAAMAEGDGLTHPAHIRAASEFAEHRKRARERRTPAVTPGQGASANAVEAAKNPDEGRRAFSEAPQGPVKLGLNCANKKLARILCLSIPPGWPLCRRGGSSAPLRESQRQVRDLFPDGVEALRDADCDDAYEDSAFHVLSGIIRSEEQQRIHPSTMLLEQVTGRCWRVQLLNAAAFCSDRCLYPGQVVRVRGSLVNEEFGPKLTIAKLEAGRKPPIPRPPPTQAAALPFAADPVHICVAHVPFRTSRAGCCPAFDSLLDHVSSSKPHALVLLGPLAEGPQDLGAAGLPELQELACQRLARLVKEDFAFDPNFRVFIVPSLRDEALGNYLPQPPMALPDLASRDMVAPGRICSTSNPAYLRVNDVLLSLTSEDPLMGIGCDMICQPSANACAAPASKVMPLVDAVCRSLVQQRTLFPGRSPASPNKVTTGFVPLFFPGV